MRSSGKKVKAQQGVPEDKKNGTKKYGNDKNAAADGQFRGQEANHAKGDCSHYQSLAEPDGIILGRTRAAETVDVIQMQRKLENDGDHDCSKEHLVAVC